MTRIVVTGLADRDTAGILSEIRRGAGYAAAERYLARFEAFYSRLTDHPLSCQSRPDLGDAVRVGVIVPYLIIYRYGAEDDIVIIIRILHRRRHLTQRLLRT